MDLSDEDSNPYDFVKQYKKLKMERKTNVVQIDLTSIDDEHQPIINSTISSDVNTQTPDSIVSISVQTKSCRGHHSKPNKKIKPATKSAKKSTKKSVEPVEPVGPVICIGDFYDGYDMPLPKVVNEKNDIDTMIEDPDTIIDNWRKRQITADEEEDALVRATRVMNVKVFWRQMRTYCFPLRMFQTLSSIYEHFAKLEDIDPSHVRLDLHKKMLSPTDTPYSINYKIVDFIDGEIEFYRSPYDTPDVPKVEEPQDDKVKFCIKQKDVKKPIFIEFKKTDKMLILYVMLSEMLGFDIDSFTLEFDGDKVKRLDTMESLGLEGDECFELYQKKTKN